jgi:xanthine/uracil/vitamin C permease (AzgA family)
MAITLMQRQIKGMVLWTVLSSILAAFVFTLKMKATKSSETLISYHITIRRYNQDHNLNLQRHENLKSPEDKQSSSTNITTVIK